MSWVAGWNEASHWAKDGSIRLEANRLGAKVQITKPTETRSRPLLVQPAHMYKPRPEFFHLISEKFCDPWMPMLAPWDLVMTVP